MFIVSSIDFLALLYSFCCLNRAAEGTFRCYALELVLKKSNQCNEPSCSHGLHPAHTHHSVHIPNLIMPFLPSLDSHAKQQPDTLSRGCTHKYTHTQIELCEHTYLPRHKQTADTQKHKSLSLYISILLPKH